MSRIGIIQMRTSLFLSIVLLSGCIHSNPNNMGLFDRLFKKKVNKQQISKSKTDTSLVKSAEMLSEDKYWLIIDNSIRNTHNQDDQENYLVRDIGKLTPIEMIGFRLRTDKLLYDSYNSEIWCAGYIMNGGCSDDMFEYFRCWIISRGKETYENTKINPDYLINEVIEGEEYYEFESFWYVALTAFQKKTGKELYDYIDYEKFKTLEGKYPPMNFSWTEDDPESMKKICPKLFKKFWKH